MNGLFKVKKKVPFSDNGIYTVYHVKWFSKKAYELRFLIYKNGKFQYVIADDYEPLEEATP